MNLGLICARLLLLLGKDSDVEPHSRLSAHLVVAYHAMLCVPVEHHTSATPVSPLLPETAMGHVILVRKCITQTPVCEAGHTPVTPHTKQTRDAEGGPKSIVTSRGTEKCKVHANSKATAAADSDLGVECTHRQRAHARLRQKTNV